VTGGGGGGGGPPRGGAAGEREGVLLEPAGGARRRTLDGGDERLCVPVLAHGVRGEARPIRVAGAAPLEVGERVGRGRPGDAERGRLQVERAVRCAAPEAVEGEARSGAVGAERAVQRVLDGYTRARGERTERARGTRREAGRARQRLAEPGAAPRQGGARRAGQGGDPAGQG